MTYRLKKSTILEYFLLICIKLVLEHGYINFVSSLFSYAGFIYELNSEKYIFGWFIYIFGYFILCSKRAIFVYYIFQLLFFLYVLPNTVFYSLANRETLDFLALVVPFFAIVLFTNNFAGFRIPQFKKGKFFILGISFVLTLIVIFNYYISTGGKIVISFAEVYEYRDEFGSASNQGLFGYLNGWVTKVFAIVLLSWALYKKKILLFIISFLAILLLFALSGHKGVLKGLFIVLFFFYLFEVTKFDKKFIILWAIFLLFGLVTLLSELLDLRIVGSLILRRLLFVPAHLNFTYLEFFSQNEFIYWSNGILKAFMEYPYDLSPVYLIGDYLGYSEMAANTGFIAVGFAHAGYLGILIYTVISIIIVNVINNLAKYNSNYFVATIIFIPLNSLFISSDLLTVLLTHGLMIAIISLWLYNDRELKIKLGKFKYEI